VHPHAQKLLGFATQAQQRYLTKVTDFAVADAMKQQLHDLRYEYVCYELKSPAILHTLRAVRGRPYFRYVTAIRYCCHDGPGGLLVR